MILIKKLQTHIVQAKVNLRIYCQMSIYGFHTLCSNAIAYLIASRAKNDEVYRCQEIELSNCRAVGEDRG